MHKSDASPPLPDITYISLPEVLVQIPLRNEQYIVQDILQAVTKLEWPREKLHIQVLDDSNDDTYTLTVSEVMKLQKQGYCLTLIHRKHNEGYKAGALATGLDYEDCDFVAVFDADFTPDSQFLMQTIPFFEIDPDLAMVQTRWTYKNSTDSYITRCQAMALDAHFVIDHIARNRSNLMMNFNGTAGIWRRSAIEQAGGWNDDTLAEDLDLSYRAQLSGLKCLYLPDVTSPSQLPGSVNAFMQQQQRWAKGAAQTLRKLWHRIIQSPQYTIGKKIMALLHLSGYFTQMLFVLLIILSLPMTLLNPSPPYYMQLLGPLSVIPLVYYVVSQTALYHDGWRSILYYPLLALLAFACSPNVSLALVDGFLHWGGVFIRTPKYSSLEISKNSSHVYNESSESQTPNTTVFLIYSILTIVTAIVMNVTRYIVPSVMFLTSQVFYFYSICYEKRKIREK